MKDSDFVEVQGNARLADKVFGNGQAPALFDEPHWRHTWTVYCDWRMWDLDGLN